MFLQNTTKPPTVPENIYDILGKKILICKKDIPCKEGVFKKYAAVYPVIVNRKITKLCDLRDWTCDNNPEEHCPVGTLTESITVSNYQDYFEVNEKAVEYFGEVLKQKHEIKDKTDMIDCAKTDFFEIALVTFAALLIGFGFVKSHSIGTYTIAVIVITAIDIFISLMLRYEKKHILKRLTPTYEDTKYKLRLCILTKEQYSGCDEAYVEMREKLVELANSSVNL